MSSPPYRGTVLPRRGLPPEDAIPEPQSVQLGLSGEDVLTVAGAAGAAIAIGLLLTTVIGAIPLGWTPVTSFIWFVALYATLVFLKDRGPAVRDKFWTVILCSAGVVVVGTLALVIGYVVVAGWPVYARIFTSSSTDTLLGRFHWFTQDMKTAGPLSGLDSGGVVYALIGTLEQIGIALVITIPLGLTTAVFLGEVGGRFARFVRTITEAMTALPSVVAGLFIWSTIILLFTHEDSGFAAALALTVLMLPITIRAADVVLRLVPGNLREAGLALGASQWSTVWRVVLPTVRSGLTTAIILATAHGIGETSPVLLTSGVTDFTNANPFSGNQTSLPLAALEFIEQPGKTAAARGFATALLLLVVVLILFGVARATAGAEPGQARGGRARRLAAQSVRTRARIAAAPRRTARDAARADQRQKAVERRHARATPKDPGAAPDGALSELFRHDEMDDKR
ncbi:PstA family ABC transporter permease [Gryllotalpicola reticulitermitis]|uniref:PstA family ABC transporter permease n=1 Tax=Gryllotalpicola reticulitermitis TaxID=1184153 RepID=A0ABV8QB96_9MICO